MAEAGDGGGGGIDAAGGVGGADAVWVGDLHAGVLPHAMGHRPRLRLPLRRVRHQPVRNLEGHHHRRRRRVLVVAEGGFGLHMVYIFQASVPADVKLNQKYVLMEVYRSSGVWAALCCCHPMFSFLDNFLPCYAATSLDGFILY